MIDPAENVWVVGTSTTLTSKLTFTGTTTYTTTNCNLPSGNKGPYGLAADAAGNIWFSDTDGSDIEEMTNTGTALSPTGGYTAGGLVGSYGIAIDGAGSAWVGNALYNNGSITGLSSTGAALSGPNGYACGGGYPHSIAIDGSGNIWVPSTSGLFVTEFIGTAVLVTTPMSAALATNKLATRP